MLDGVRLGEKSPAALAVTSWRDQLYLAWTGSDLHINLASSPDGREITGKQRLAQQSYAQVMVGSYQARVSQKQAMGPSLAVSGERLYLAWTDGDSAVSVVAVEEPVRAAPVTLDERSGCPPSLTAADDGNLVLAWAELTVTVTSICSLWPRTIRHARTAHGREDPVRGGEEQHRADGVQPSGRPGPGLEGHRPPHQHPGHCRGPLRCAGLAGRGEKRLRARALQPSGQPRSGLVRYRPPHQRGASAIAGQSSA